jgi:hypothetical protein
MPIDRKAYKADKKSYKKEEKNAKKVFKETGFKSYGNPFAPKRSDYKEGAYRRYEESPIQETENLIKENPVVNRSDDNENIGRGGKGPKPMSKTRRAKASLMQLKDGLVSRFQSSTPKIGKNELMKPVLESLKPMAIKVGPKETPSRLPNTKIRSYDFDGTSMKQQSASPSPKPKKKT